MAIEPTEQRIIDRFEPREPETPIRQEGVTPELVLFAAGKMKSEGLPDQMIVDFLAQQGYGDEGSLSELKARGKQLEADPEILPVFEDYDRRLSVYLDEMGLGDKTRRVLRGALTPG